MLIERTKVDLLRVSRGIAYRAIGMLLLPANRLLNPAKLSKWGWELAG
jgi:hypothetical protein